MKDLAPQIKRQRLIIEATTKDAIAPTLMYEYLYGISKVLDMTPYSSPSFSLHEDYGWCAHMHWVESGISLYTWKNEDPIFFTIDIYTCKPFKVEKAIDYTKIFFNCQDIEHKEV